MAPHTPHINFVKIHLDIPSVDLYLCLTRKVRTSKWSTMSKPLYSTFNIVRCMQLKGHLNDSSPYFYKSITTLRMTPSIVCTWGWSKRTKLWCENVRNNNTYRKSKVVVKRYSWSKCNKIESQCAILWVNCLLLLHNHYYDTQNSHLGGKCKEYRTMSKGRWAHLSLLSFLQINDKHTKFHVQAHITPTPTPKFGVYKI